MEKHRQEKPLFTDDTKRVKIYKSKGGYKLFYKGDYVAWFARIASALYYITQEFP